MGKYSIDAYYENYKMIKCRPEELLEPTEGAGINTFKTVDVAFGCEIPQFTEKTLLRIVVDADADVLLAEAKLRMMAARCYRDAQVLGVMIDARTGRAAARRLWEAAAEAFAPKRFYVPVQDGEQLDYALKHGIAGGLYVRVGENPYDVCEAFADQGAQQLYKQMPVLVSFEKETADSARYAAQWHAAAVEGAKAISGWRIALRRMTCPSKLSSGGYAPMRFWWTNAGPSYCHEKTQLKLLLEKDGKRISVENGDKPAYIHLADRTHNEIIRLPEVEPGRYTLLYGLFTQDGEALVLAHEGRDAEGFYTAGVLEIDDTPRPEHRTIWDHFAPDGYYPLEDPKEPGQS